MPIKHNSSAHIHFRSVRTVITICGLAIIFIFTLIKFEKVYHYRLFELLVETSRFCVVTIGSSLKRMALLLIVVNLARVRRVWTRASLHRPLLSQNEIMKCICFVSVNIF